MIHRSHSFGQVSALLRRHPPLECWELASHGPSPVWIWSNNSLKIRRTDYQQKLGSKSWLEHFQVPVEGLDSTWVFQVVSMMLNWHSRVSGWDGWRSTENHPWQGTDLLRPGDECNADSWWEYLGVLRWPTVPCWFSLVPVVQIRTCKQPPVGSNAAVSINSSIWKCFAYLTSSHQLHKLIYFDTSWYFRWYFTSTLAHFPQSFLNLKIPCARWNPHLGCCLMKQGPQLSMRAWQRNHWELPDICRYSALATPRPLGFDIWQIWNLASTTDTQFQNVVGSINQTSGTVRLESQTPLS
jgi:hypothetical protein